MAKKKAKSACVGGLNSVTDYRLPEATRKNNPPAKIAAEGHVPLIPKAVYSFKRGGHQGAQDGGPDRADVRRPPDPGRRLEEAGAGRVARYLRQRPRADAP